MRAFKDELDLEAPMLFPASGWDKTGGTFVAAWDIGPAMFVKENEVQYGPMQPEFKEYLQMVNKWYEEGLIDKDFATRDQKSIDAMAASGKAGAWLSSWGEGLQKYLTLNKDDAEYDLIAAQYPSNEEGVKPNYRQANNVVRGPYTTITSKCEYPEEVVRWLDYGFTEEGALLFSFGIEDESYEMIDGKPELTELIYDNPDGIPYASIALKYKLHNGSQWRYIDSHVADEKVVEAQNIWTLADTDLVMPPVTPSADESSEYSSIMSDINTYVEQMVLKFIMGVEPIDKFDEYVEQIEKMNIDRAIEIQQSAVQRFKERTKQ